MTTEVPIFYQVTHQFRDTLMKRVRNGPQEVQISFNSGLPNLMYGSLSFQDRSSAMDS